MRLGSAAEVAGDLNGQFAELTLESLAAPAVAGVTRLISYGLVLCMPYMRFHLGLQGAFSFGFGNLLEQAMLANQVFGLLIARHQAFDQVCRWGFCYGHCYSIYSGGSFPANDRLHK